MYELAAPREGVSLPFVNLIDPQTRAALQELLREFLEPAGIEHIDVPEVTSKNRVQTRLLSRALYSMADDDGRPSFAGICYESRYDSRETCWAVFDHFPVEVIRQSPIGTSDEVLRKAARDLGLTVH